MTRQSTPTSALASDVERLARLARDKFLEALTPDDLREHTVLQHPETVDDALKIAREKEALRSSIGSGSTPAKLLQVTLTALLRRQGVRAATPRHRRWRATSIA